MNDFWSFSEITPLQAACFNKMKRLELRLGRLAHIFAWQQVDQTVTSVLHAQGAEIGGLVESEILFDASLGLLLLKADTSQLDRLTSLPDVLDNLGLVYASIALRYATRL